MKPSINLIRKHYPAFMAELDKIKQQFGAVQLNTVKCAKVEFGSITSGVEVNPVISDSIALKGALKANTGRKRKK